MTLPTYSQIELPLLKEIWKAGGEARPRDIYPLIRQHFPHITDQELQLKLPSGSGNLWTNRIQWARQSLVAKGELYREPRGIWRITERGKARAEGLEAASDAKAEPASEHVDGAGGETATVLVMADEVERLCMHLQRTQKQSSAPKNFEHALAQAFRFLGLSVREQGKPGETDLILDAYLGPESYRVIVDAKATHSDRVSDNQINWLAIDQHKQATGAQYSAVVGVDFRGGNLLKWADQYQVALIRTTALIEIIRLYRGTPFTLIELRPLFATPGLTDATLQNLRLVHESILRHWQLLLEVVEQIDNYNRFNNAGLVATPDRIQLMLYTKFRDSDPSRVPSTEDVKDAMTFLASRAIGVLREAPEPTGGYQLTMQLEAAVRRITALTRYLDGIQPKPGSAAESKPTTA